MVMILSPDALSEVRLTVDEYLAAELPEGHRYELVEGVVQVSPVPGIPHDVLIARLHELFVLYKSRRRDVVAHITQKSAVALSARGTVREPDLAVYSPDQAPARFKTWKDPIASLIVEVVSPGQETRDYEEKRRDYWDAGVAEYWIADPMRRTLTVLARGESDWAETVLDVEASYATERLPGLEFNVAELFAE